VRRRSEILSIGLSGAIALALVMQISFRPSRPAESEPPTRTVVETPASASTAQLAAITLPPPPALPQPPAAASPEIIAEVETTGPTAEVVPLAPRNTPTATAPAIPLATLRTAEVVPAAAEPQSIAPLKPTKASPRPEASKAPLAPPSPQTAPSEPQGASIPDQENEVVGANDSNAVMAAGRPLLRLLEHGDGPGIHIAWPKLMRERDALFRSFERCYGMLVALMSSDGSLFSDRSAEVPWEINLDRYSGFVRQSGGLGTEDERAWVRRILTRHPRAAGAAAIRVFPRMTDALLMGGLKQLLGTSYRGTRAIAAKYARDGSSISIVDIVADGKSIPGRIDLSASASRSCRAARAAGGA
jgi:hypothetical protein